MDNISVGEEKVNQCDREILTAKEAKKISDGFVDREVNKIVNDMISRIESSAQSGMNNVIQIVGKELILMVNQKLTEKLEPLGYNIEIGESPNSQCQYVYASISW